MMQNNDEDARLLDELLDRNYQRLRQPVAGQWEAVLGGLAEAQDRGALRPRHTWSRPAAWLATAACVAVAILVAALLPHSSAGVVYGIETVPTRLREVQTIRIRGWQIVHDRSAPDSPPDYVPIEYLVKRPNQFRYSFVGVSQGAGPPEIRRGSQVCDGSVLWVIHETQQQYLSKAVSPLDARLRTEMTAQGLAVLAMLGPPDASFKRIGQVTLHSRPCGIYQTRFGETLATAWLDESSGDLVRVIHDEVRADGTIQRKMDLDDIALNLPLSDELFGFTPPEGYKALAEQPATTKRRRLLDLTANYSAASNGQTLEAWQALRVTPGAALVLWRRSKPAPSDGGTVDWLSNLDIRLVGPKRDATLRHTWLYRSDSAERWNWSLVYWNGRWPERGDVRFELRTTGGRSALELLPLRLSERELEQIILGASRATLPEADQYSLTRIRKRAGELSSN